jgi:hypothetical protein
MPQTNVLKGRPMKSRPLNSFRIALLGLCCVAAPAVFAGEKFELPPEITPAIREACEQNVRQLCVTPTSTTSSVVSCVRRNFINLNKKCRNELVSAGLI